MSTILAIATGTKHYKLALPAQEAVPLIPGARYSLINPATRREPESLRVIRDGNDLRLEVAGETVAEVPGFWLPGTGARFMTETSIVDLSPPKPEVKVVEVFQPVEAEPPRVDADDTAEVVEENLAAAPAVVTPVVPAATVTVMTAEAASRRPDETSATEEASAAESASADERGPVFATLGGIALAGGAVAALSGGSSDGGGTSSATSLNGTVTAGPLTPNHGLSAVAYRADGSELARGTINADGSYTLSYSENYTGAVLVRVLDADGGADYIDEATGQGRDLVGELRAIVNVDGPGDYRVNINPLTELAVRELDLPLGEPGAFGLLNVAQILAANSGVAAAFGLGAIDPTDAPVIPTVDAAGNPVPQANAIGQVLAMISALETQNQTDLPSVLTRLANDLVGNSLPLATRTELAQAVIVQNLLSAEQVEALLGVDQSPGTDPNPPGTDQPPGGTPGGPAPGVGTGNGGVAVPQRPVFQNPELLVAAENSAIAGTIQATAAAANPVTYVISAGADRGLFQIDADTGELSFAIPPDFENPGDAGGDNVYNLQIIASDGRNQAFQNVRIQVTNLNDNAPVLQSPNLFAVAENTAAVGTVAATDQDGTVPTYRISGGPDAALFSLDATTGVLAFNAAPDFEAPADAGADNSYQIQITASDGLNETNQNLTITVSNLNDNAPAFQTGDTLNVLENVTATGGALATDADGNPLTYSITGGADQALFAIDATTGALSFIAAPDFESPGDANADNNYQLQLTVTDGTFSTVQNLTVTVGAVNEAPSFTSLNVFGITENATAVPSPLTAVDQDNSTLSFAIIGGTDQARLTVDSATGALSFVTAPDFEAPVDANADNVYNLQVSVSDGTNTTTQNIVVQVSNVNDVVPSFQTPSAFNVAENGTVVATVVAVDADGPSLSYSITGGADQARFAINSSSGALSFVAAPDFEAPGDSGGDNTYNIDVTVSDGTFEATQNLAITVTNVDDVAPVFQSPTNFNVAENTTAVGTVNATDVDSANLVYSLTGGADAALFTVNAASGALSFNAAPDFEAAADAGADNVYDLQITATDGGNNSTVQSIAVTVTNIDEAPVFTTPAAFNVAENTTAVGTLAATDPESAVVTFALTGGADQALFSLNANTGALSFNAPPDFEAPGSAATSNVYNLQVTATDASNNSAVQSIAVTVTNIDEAPAFTTPTAFNVAENTTAVATLAATDPESAAVTYALTGGADQALFSLNANTGALSFNAPPNFEAPADTGADNVYDLQVTATDAANNSTVQSIAVTVTNIDEAPAFTTPATFNVAENTTAVATLAATDPESAAVSYALTGGADQALFSLNANTGALSFNAAQDFEAPADAGADNVYDLQVTATDASNNSAVQSIAVTVTNIDEAPVFTTAAAFNVAENSTAVGTVAATDPEAAAVSYALTGGADQAAFAIDPNTGALSFVNAPDFEAPGSVANSNVYNIQVTATDASNNSVVQSLTVSVTDVFDVELSAISAGTGGFVINGASEIDISGYSVSSAGDVNGDGLDDLIVGAPLADSGGFDTSGESYVVFGRTGSAAVELSALGSGGFVINGAQAGDFSGLPVSSAGDVNGDGLDDLIVGARDADPGGRDRAGESYVVFGRTDTWAVELSALGSAGFVISGDMARDASGGSVSSAGDVNGDGLDDLIVGADGAYPGGRTSAGASYVVFGRTDTAAVELSALGSGGFVINGATAGDRSGRSVSSAGDVNGDGLDDLIVGAFRADPGGRESAGASYVVFGRSDTTAVELSALGSGGFVINGALEDDKSGYSVSSAGDVNGDGLDDLIVGTLHFQPFPGAVPVAGESYVVFGRTDTAAVELSALGSGGFVINGASEGDRSGNSVSSAGDVNGDGLDDLIVGAFAADPGGRTDAGESYVVFGRTDTAAVELSALGNGGFVINGIEASDLSGGSVSSAGDVNGDGFADLIVGASDADPGDPGAERERAGESYVIFGGDFFNQIAAANIGTAGNDTDLSGSNDTGIESLIGGRGNDTLDGGPGNDILIGGEGNDTLIYDAADTLRVDGGNGRDELLINGSGVALNLTNLNNFGPQAPANPLSSIEIINLTGSGNNSLALNASDLLHLVGAAGDPGARQQNLLRVDGGVGDTISTTDTGWVLQGVRNAEGETGNGYTLYAQGRARLLVQDGIDRSGVMLQQQAPEFDLRDLNGTNGFVLHGADAGDGSGFSVANAGDVNGDGFDDLLIGARYADGPGAAPGDREGAGDSYLVFGGTALGSSGPIDLGALDGSNGFVLHGVAADDRSGSRVSSAGDVNGDGFADLLFQSAYADRPGAPNGNNDDTGESYLVYGGSAVAPTGALDLSALDGNNGFVLNGVDPGDRAGFAVASAGDVNGDGYDDLLIGALDGDGPGASPGTRDRAGDSYLVFGGSALTAGGELELSTLNGSNGFVLHGAQPIDFSGFSVAGAGDVNGDGFDDLVIGANFAANLDGDARAGANFVVFGGATVGASGAVDLSTLDGNNGFVLRGVDPFDYSGSSVSIVGDVNGDGFADLMVGARSADGSGNLSTGAGDSYLVFGGAAVGAGGELELSTLNGSNGFVLHGVDGQDRSGHSVSNAGDVNGDGYDDLLIGAFGADGPGASPGDREFAGDSYLIFGGTAMAPTGAMELSDLNGHNGFVLQGVDAEDRSGIRVSSAGDINGDGFADLVIGAYRADGPGASPGDRDRAGDSYVIFGGNFSNAVTVLGSLGADQLVGTDADERMVAGTGNDTLDGGLGNDVLIGGEGDDTLIFDAADTLRVDGGNGRDTLQINGSGVALNLSALNNFAAQAPGNPLSSIEIIDLRATVGNNALTLDASDLLRLVGAAGDPDSRQQNLLRVDGGAGDSVSTGTTAGAWQNLGARDADGNAGSGYTLHQNGQARLLVQDGVNQDGIFNPTVELSDVSQGQGGFAINGIDAQDYSGISVSSAGDVNGDGLDDLIIGASRADPPSRNLAGESYVVFGKTNGGVVELAQLAQISGGFVINGAAAYNQSGRSVSSAGDVNGDGLDDLIVGAFGADPAGESYVIFGKTDFGVVELPDVQQGTGGFVINGASAGDSSGRSVSSAGDVNGDGLDDLIVGADRANGYAGESYVVFGRSDTTAVNLSAVAGGNGGGFVLNGIDANDYSGHSVSSAGDVNGDGLDDLIVGAYGAGPGTPMRDSAGESYVVFGRTATTAVELSAVAGGTGGFVINGLDNLDGSGRSVSSAGDVNGDGLDDLIVGANAADPGDRFNAGESYVVFGRTGTTAVDLSAVAAGNGGFVINGIDAVDNSGFSVSSAGDINGDGLDDLIVGANTANPGSPARNFAGESYVVFGRTGTTAVELSAVAAGNGGFAINGIDAGDRSGYSVSSAGDVNGDGFADLVVGTRNADPDGRTNAGESYVIFGGDFLNQIAAANIGTAGDDTNLVGSNDTGIESLIGGRGNDTLNGGAGNDVLIGGEGNDTLIYDAADTLRVDGGNGRDTLQVNGSGVALNLSNLNNFAAQAPGNPLSSIEIVDLTGSGDNSLALNASDLLHLVGASGDPSARQQNLLRVDGDAGDSVSTTAGQWQNFGARDGNGNAGSGYTLYQNGQARLLVQDNIDQSGIFNPTVELADVSQGQGGFVINGINQNDYSGLSVSSAGDVNGDGLDDVIVGAFRGDPGDPAREDAGESYVVFGKTDGTAVELSDVAAGAGGFVINGVKGAIGGGKGDESGRSVSSAGDVNGDGLDDLIVAAFQASPGGRTDAGASYVVFGKTDSGVVELADVAQGTGGFVMNGPSPSDQSGRSVSSAGDVNGDGLDDLIVGAPGGDPPGLGNAGESYVVFGRTAGTPVELLDVMSGTGGFVINGVAASDRSGFSVSSAGDVNGDGLDDLIVGAFTSNFSSNSGESYVVFGKTDGIAVELSDVTQGTGGFVINGPTASDGSGSSVSSAGDVNGDGLDDLIVGAYTTDLGSPERTNAGASYVVFGKTDGGAVALADVAAGTGGFVINGVNGAIGGGKGDESGRSVSSAGDVNGDGLDDLIVGAERRDPGSPARNDAGASYVVFGRTGGGPVELSALGTDGFAINGGTVGDRTGFPVSSAGDVNGDGFDDLLVGARQADPGASGPSNAGESYVIFGGDFFGQIDSTNIGDAGNNTLDGDNLDSGSNADQSLIGGRGDDTLDGGGGNDVLIGGEGNDTLIYDAADLLRVDGGNGEDTLQLVSGQNLDLTSLNNFAGQAPANPLQNIERIDMATDTSGNSVTIDLQDLLALSDTTNTIQIIGGGNDQVDLSSSDFVDSGQNRTIGSVDFVVYTDPASADAELLIQVGVPVV